MTIEFDIKSINWSHCAKCGRNIKIGEISYDVGDDSYCADCCKPIDTLQACLSSDEAINFEEEQL